MISELSQQFTTLAVSFAGNAEVSGLPGMLPIRCQRAVVGGLGVAGGSHERDRLIAEVALARLPCE